MFRVINADTAFLFFQIACNEKQWMHWFDKEKPEELGAILVPRSYARIGGQVHCRLARREVRQGSDRGPGERAQTGHPWSVYLPWDQIHQLALRHSLRNSKLVSYGLYLTKLSQHVCWFKQYLFLDN